MKLEPRAAASDGLVELDPGAGSGIAGGTEGDDRGGEVLDREAERLEDRDLRVVLPALAGGQPGHQVADLGADVPGPDRAVGGSQQVVARLGEDRLPAIR